MKIKWQPHAIIILITLFCSTGACTRKEKSSEPPQEILVTSVVRGSIEHKVLFTGNIVAKDAVEIFPRAGGKIVKHLLQEGDPVGRGQGILEIDRDEIGYSFRPLIVDSPIDGYVGTITADVGAYVYDRNILSSQKPVAVVVRSRTMKVKLDVPERYLAAILPGTSVSISVDSTNNALYEGSIITSSPIVDEKTRTAKIEAEIQNTDGRLRHGMFGRMELVVEKRDNTLVAPPKAISWEGEKQFVYKIADGKAVRIQVKTGLRNNTSIELISGAVEGEILAISDLINLEDGEVVAIKE